MPKNHDQIMGEELEAVVELLQNLLALELSKSGVTHDGICKRLHVTKTKVGEMLQGVKKEK